MDKHLLTLQLKQIMDRQLELLRHLRLRLGECTLIQAKTFTLPPNDPDAETRDATFIPVIPQQDRQALANAIHAWSHLFATPDESTRLVYRLPGAVQIAARGADDIPQLVKEMNDKRAEFQEAVTTSALLKSPESRHEYLHSRGMFPMLITLHMYRSIPLVAESSRSISFCWAHKYSQKNITREHLLQALERAQRHPPKHIIDPTDWIAQLEEEKVSLLSLPASTPLQIRRPLPVQPQAWAVTDAGRHMFVASTPLLIIDDRPIKIGNLPDYDHQQRRKSRVPRTTESEPIIPRLWLYAKKHD